jgi:hypothetical protein
MWEPRRLANLWASTASYRDSFTFYLLSIGSQIGRILDDTGFMSVLRLERRTLRIIEGRFMKIERCSVRGLKCCPWNTCTSAVNKLCFSTQTFRNGFGIAVMFGHVFGMYSFRILTGIPAEVFSDYSVAPGRWRHSTSIRPPLLSNPLNLSFVDHFTIRCCT